MLDYYSIKLQNINVKIEVYSVMVSLHVKRLRGKLLVYL